MAGLYEGLQWFRTTASSRHVQKRWFRATIVFAVMMVLMIDHITIEKLGQAAVFACVMAAVLPPFLPFSAHLYMMAIMLFACLVGWGWLVAADAAGAASPSPEMLAQQLAGMNHSLVPDSHIPLWQQTEEVVSSGNFANLNSSILYGLFFLISTFFFALGLARRPELAFVLYIALTLADAIAVSYPLIPISVSLGPLTFVLAAASYAAISLASLVLIFPESYNHAWMCRAREEILLPAIAFLKKPLSDSKADPQAPLNHTMHATIKRYQRETTLFSLEFSIHRLTPKQLLGIQSHITQLVYKTTALEHAEKCFQFAFRGEGDSSERMGGTCTEHAHGRVLHFADALRVSCQVSLMNIEEWFRECNMDPWFDVFRAVDRKKVDYRRLRLEISRANLRKVLSKFRNEELEELTEAFKPSLPLKRGKGVDCRAKAASPEFIAFSLLDRLDGLASTLINFHDALIEIEDGEPKPRIRFPEIFRTMFTRKPKPPTNTSSQHLRPAPPEGGEKDNEPSPSPPAYQRTILSFQSAAIPELPGEYSSDTKKQKRSGLVNWLCSPEALYVFRVCVVSLALWIPSMCPSTAVLYDEHDGLLGLLLGQSYVAMFAGDQVYLFLLRFGATLVGLLLSAIGWYIATASGNETGNHYLVVIISTILVLPSLLVNVSSHKPRHVLFSTLVSTTAVATIGIAWSQMDSTLGYNSKTFPKALYQRILMDLIGFTASAVVMMVPRPTTVKSRLISRLSTSLRQAGLLVYNERERLASLDNNPSDGSSVTAIREILDKHRQSAYFLDSMKFDPHVEPLPFELYRKLFDAQARLLESIVPFFESLQRLDPSFKNKLRSSKALYLDQKLLQNIYNCITYLANILSGDRIVVRGASVQLRESVLQQAHDFTSKREANHQIAPLDARTIVGLFSFLRPVEDVVTSTSSLSLGSRAEYQLSELMTLSTVVVNFNLIVDSIDDLGKIIKQIYLKN